MKQLPPGYILVRQDEYRPSGCPPRGSIWAHGPGGVATTVYQDEAAVVEAAWELHDRMARMRMKDKAA